MEGFFYPTVGARVWVAAPAGRWAGVVVGAPGENVGEWEIAREPGEEGGGGHERVGHERLAPRPLGAGQPPAPARGAPNAPQPEQQPQPEPEPQPQPQAAADTPEVLPPAAPLPAPERGFSIASFNMLTNQWFAEKYYQYDTPAPVRQWSARGALMRGAPCQPSGR